MKRSYVKKTLFSLSFVIFLCLLSKGVVAKAETITGETSLCGASFYINRFYDEIEEDETLTSLLAEEVAVPENIAVADVNDFVNIRQNAGTGYSVVGYLPKNGVCEVLEVENGWAKIKSGSVSGYVSTEYLFMGDEGKDKAEELAALMATVNAGTVNFRSEPDTTSDNIIATVSRGEALQVIEETVINKEDDTTLWVKAVADDVDGYIAKDFVNVDYDWVKAVPLTSVISDTPKKSSSGKKQSSGDADGKPIVTDLTETGLSELRASLIIEAKKHVGLRYVWGGMSLSDGADCSGFCLAVYKECGISISALPRSSYDLASSSKGRTVSLSEAKAGDLVFYGKPSGRVDHVALYMGNGQVIHESGRESGCKISDVDYRAIIKIKNFID